MRLSESEAFVTYEMQTTLSSMPIKEINIGRWKEDASCRTATTEQLYPEKGRISREMHETCISCNVIGPCAVSGVIETEPLGIRAGFGEDGFKEFATRKRGWVNREIRINNPTTELR